MDRAARNAAREEYAVELAALIAITIASGMGVTFGTMGIVAWLEREFGLRLG